MGILRFICFLILLPLLATGVLAQEKSDETQKEKARQLKVLTDQILGEIPNLRLSENRSFVYAKAGSILWQSDPETGSALFQKAVAELIRSQQADGVKRDQRFQNEVLSGQPVRSQILNTIAGRNAELALDALYKTRPQIVADALMFRPEKSTKISNLSYNYGYIAQNEIALEQTLMRMAAEQNPERTAKLLKESIEKGLSNETFNLLQRLYAKDPAMADEMTIAIVDKLTRNKFMAGSQPDNQAIGNAYNLLNNFVQERPPATKFVGSDPSQMRILVEKLTAFYLDSKQQNYGYYLPVLIKVAEKLLPGSVERLKQAYAESRKRGGEDEYADEIGKLLNSESTADQLIAEAKKYPLNSRGQILQKAAAKFSEQGNAERARQVLEDSFSDQELENALGNISANRIGQLQSEGRFVEAERLIDEMPESNRIGALVNLANTAFEKNRDENRSYATALLTKARSLIPERPENSGDMGYAMQIISAFANIDPDEAVRSMSLLIPQINELVDASVIVYGFQGNQNVRQDEMVIANGVSFGFYLDYSVLARLAEKDLEKAMRLVDGLSRRELRVAIKLQFAESGGFNSIPIQGRQFRMLSRK